MSISTTIYEFGPFRVDLGRQVLLFEGAPIHLPPKTFALLAALLEHHGELVSKEHLIAALWPDTVGTEANLGVNMSALRKALGEKPKEHRYIITVPQRGYSFVAKVKRVEAAANAGGSNRAEVDGASVKHLAVLPFRVLDSNDGKAVLGLGFADGVITHLAKVPELSVRSTGTVHRISRDPMAPTEIGNTLKVEEVVEGTLTRAGDRLTVTVQLVRCATGSLVWGENYASRLQDLQDLQIRIAEDLLGALRVPWDPALQPAAFTPPSRNIEAFSLYLQARAHSSGIDVALLQEAIGLFEAALARDPKFALAHTGLADTYHTLWTLGRLDTKEAVIRIERAARSALDLDPAQAEAHVWLGNVATVYRHDLREAERHFRRSLELSPNGTTALRYYAVYLIVAGRPESALLVARRAQALDPTSPPINLVVASALYYGREYERAAGLFRAMAEVGPRSTWFQFMFAWCLIQLHREQEALEFLRKFTARDGDRNPWKLALTGYLESKLGEREAALRRLNAISSSVAPPEPPPTARAILYLGLGDLERAMDALDQAYADRHPFICYLHVDPFWDPLRAEPRFRNLVQRIGFTQE